MRTGKLKYNILRPKSESMPSAATLTINSSHVFLTTDVNQIRAINGGITGQLLIITAGSSGGAVIKAAISLGPSDNINLVSYDSAAIDCNLSHGQSLFLIYDGTKWIEIGRDSSTGATGIQGVPGIQGGIGTQGIQGNQGANGAQGAQGDIGPFGIPGNQGSRGVQGSQGIQGFIGATGSIGTVGLPGTQGNQGDVGAQGDVGPQGNQGAQGAQG